MTEKDEIRIKAIEDAKKIYQDGYYSSPKLISDIAYTLEPLYRRIKDLEESYECEIGLRRYDIATYTTRLLNAEAELTRYKTKVHHLQDELSIAVKTKDMYLRATDSKKDKEIQRLQSLLDKAKQCLGDIILNVSYPVNYETFKQMFRDVKDTLKEIEDGRK